MTASTCGWAAITTSSLGAEAAGDDDLLFSARASPMASRDSSTAASMKPQVLMTTRSEPFVGRGDLIALGPQTVRMCSESTKALGQPRKRSRLSGRPRFWIGSCVKT